MIKKKQKLSVDTTPLIILSNGITVNVSNIIKITGTATSIPTVETNINVGGYREIYKFNITQDDYKEIVKYYSINSSNR